jgi:ABC-type transport system involved in cytochrome c biogenesis permease subunit
MDFLSRLSVLCFAGTYLLALASDLARLVVRNPARWYLTVALTLLGWGVHTAYLGNLAWRDHQVPVTTVRESLLVLAWILAAIDLYLIARSPRPVAIGVFILPVVVAMSGFAALEGGRASWTGWGGWLGFWGAVHGVFLLFGGVATCVAFVAGLMYLAQADRLKRKRPSRLGLALPSLEQSERLNRGAITLAFPLLSFGFLIGLGLIVASRRGGTAALSWTDPKVLSGLGLWLIFAVLLNARYRPSMRGRRVMLLSVITFLFMIFTWVGVGLILPTEHGLPPTGGGVP